VSVVGAAEQRAAAAAARNRKGGSRSDRGVYACGAHAHTWERITGIRNED
jgi:hypothetical protein